MTRGHRLTRQELGALGEQLAAEYLQQNGYRIAARNWRCRSGELDIVAENDELLVFIEVRSRTNTGTFGTGQESIDIRKQRKVRETAQVYMYAKKTNESIPVRFDVICAVFHPDGTLDKLDYIRNAF